ncbi:hypothetical protein A2U01_0081289, partial [Trifolium medium]|nr:hypothetical protein [Trifolium medium]
MRQANHMSHQHVYHMYNDSRATSTYVASHADVTCESLSM